MSIDILIDWIGFLRRIGNISAIYRRSIDIYYPNRLFLFCDVFSYVFAFKAIEKMQKEFEEEKSKSTPGVCSRETLAVEFMKLDLTSLKSVESFVESFKAKESKLHILLCNAGIALHEQGTFIVFCPKNYLIWKIDYFLQKGIKSPI